MAENSKKSEKRAKGERKPPLRNRPPKDKFEWKKATKTLTFWILIILGSIVISQLYSGQVQREEPIPYTRFVTMVESGQIEKGVVVDREFHGVLKADAVSQREKTATNRNFVTVLPYIDKDMLELWNKNNIAYEFKDKTTNWFGYLLSSILPWVILIGIWILLMRRMQGGGTKGIFSFGKSKARLLTENRPKITFEDVAGADEAKAEVQEIIEFLKDPKKFQKLGGRIPRGALLLGPPGTGKTLLAKAIAGEAGVPFFSMSGADFVEMFVGVGASRVRDLFEQGKKNAPCIIFIDEIDAVGRHRGAGLGGGHDEREQTLNQLLVEMDGFDSNEGVILVAATNRPDVLDPALLRPGRFDRQIVVDRPDLKGRTEILKVHTKKIPLGDDIDMEVIAKGTPGLSGADLANIVNEAALIAAKRNADKVSMPDFEAAKDKIMMGMERKSLIISETERKNTAYHEAGHVLVAKLTPGSDPVHKVTIIPRGRALGLTHLLPMDEKHNYSRGYLNAMLTHLLGGRAAEKVVLNELTTGAGNDIERATEIARKMVCEWGMSEKLGPMTFGKKEEEIFLGREIAKHRDYSERTAIEIDHEVRRIIEKAERSAEDLVRKNVDKLHALAAALLEREILDGNEIDTLMHGKKLPPVKKSLPQPREKAVVPEAVEGQEVTSKPSPHHYRRSRRRYYRGKRSVSTSQSAPRETGSSEKTGEVPPAVEVKAPAHEKPQSEAKTPSYIRRSSARRRAHAKTKASDSLLKDIDNVDNSSSGKNEPKSNE
jgi:cell division protease FtsH